MSKKCEATLHSVEAYAVLKFPKFHVYMYIVSFCELTSETCFLLWRFSFWFPGGGGGGGGSGSSRSSACCCSSCCHYCYLCHHHDDDYYYLYRYIACCFVCAPWPANQDGSLGSQRQSGNTKKQKVYKFRDPMSTQVTNLKTKTNPCMLHGAPASVSTNKNNNKNSNSNSNSNSNNNSNNNNNNNKKNKNKKNKNNNKKKKKKKKKKKDNKDNKDSDNKHIKEQTTTRTRTTKKNKNKKQPQATLLAQLFWSSSNWWIWSYETWLCSQCDKWFSEESHSRDHWFDIGIHSGGFLMLSHTEDLSNKYLFC